MTPIAMTRPPALFPLLATLILGSATAFAAGFDCAKAATPVEKMICADAGLSRLDETLATVYAARAADSAVKTEQRQWLRQVRNACATPACLATAYQQRIADLQQRLASPSPFPAVYAGGFTGEERLEFTADGRLLENGQPSGHYRPDPKSPWPDARHPLLLTQDGQERHCKLQPDLRQLICDDGGTLAAVYDRQGAAPAVPLPTKCDEEQLYLDVMAAARRQVPGMDLKGATDIAQDARGDCVISLYFLDNGAEVEVKARYDLKARPVQLILLDPSR